MPYRMHAAPMAGFFGYDPVQDLPLDHLARFIEGAVENSVHPRVKGQGRGQREFDPRLLTKVLLYGYATGIRSSRQLERLCNESLPYLFLTRGDTPCYHTLSTFRVEQTKFIEQVWLDLFEIAGQVGLKRMGQITIDSSKFRADASPDAVVKAGEYQPVIAELKRMLAESAAIDAAEDNQAPGRTRLERTVGHDQMRDILRRVRKQRQPSSTVPDGQAQSVPTGSAAASDSAPCVISPRMRKRIEAGIATIEAAEAEGRKHACLTDPDARMMGEGREKHVREGHAFEVAVDNGLLVAGQSSNSAADNPRMAGLVEAARKHEPDGLHAVDADSGYYSGAAVAALLAEGIDVCIPDSNTACDLHRDQPIGTTLSRITGSVAFEYNSERDVYTCPEDNVLVFHQSRTERGQDFRIYRAARSCEDCPLRSQCGRKDLGKHRTLHILANKDIMDAHLARFSEDAHRERYARRGAAVETVFAFIRAVLGYRRWQLRGSERVECEAQLFKTAYQIRKIHHRFAAGAA